MLRWRKTKNNNSLPFIVLLLLHFLILLITLYKKRDKHYFVLLLSNIGFAYLFEFFVLNLFHAYKYYPNLLKNRQQDNILGAVFSQGIYVPIIATTITAFRLNWKWKLFYAAYFICIEQLFIYLKLFQKNWWKTYYTFFFLLLFFYISDILHPLLKNNPVVKGITSYNSIYSYIMTVLVVPSVLKKLKMGFGAFRTWEVHFMIVPMYAYILSAITWITYHIRLKYSTLLGFILVLMIDYLLYTFKIFKNKKTIFILFPLHILTFFISKRLFNLIYDGEI